MIFNPLGGIPQLQLDTAEEIGRIGELDRARWAATSVLCDQLFTDPGFLAYMDDDKNGRVRVDEVLAARVWLWDRLSGRDGITQRSDTLRLADLDTSKADAKKLHSLAGRLLTKLGNTASEAITLQQVRGFEASYAKTFPNGDGVVAASQVSDEGVVGLINDVVAATGGSMDLGGEAGATVALLDTWRDRAQALLAWRGQVEGDGAKAVLAYGEATADVAAIITSLSPKVAQFFAQCALVGAETGAGARLTATPEELAALDVKDPAAIERWLDQAPLGSVDASGSLNLNGMLNPRYRAQLDRIASEIGPKALGQTDRLQALTVESWAAILASVAPYIAWQGAKPSGIVEDTAADRLAVAIDSPAATRLRELCAEDLGVADELQEFHNLEKLILFQRWFLEFCNNFVSFQQLFSPDERSLFEAGTLVLDGRKLTLCMNVLNAATHKAIASKSKMFIAYADITRKDATGADQKGKIAAAVTAGDQGGIDVGKRGVFYDRQEAEWDALITDIVAQPISVWEAMIAPITRLRDFISKRVADMVGSKAASLEESTTKTAGETAVLPPPPAPAPPAAPAAPGAAGGNMQAMLLGGSVAIAAIGSTLAYVVQTITAINPLDLVAGLGSLVAGLMAISGVIGWFRLRQRDLSTLLEASGWALNGRMKLTFALGAQFTEEPKLPQGSVLRLTAEQKRSYVVVTLLAFALLFIGYWFATHPELLEMLKPAPVDPAAAPPAAAPATPPA